MISACSVLRAGCDEALTLLSETRAPSHFPIDAISLIAAVTVPKFSELPISSAIIERIRRSLRLRESLTAASNARGRPSQLRKDPDFSVTAATGRTTSARSVTALGAISSETTNALSRAAKVAELLAPSSGSTPPTTSAPIFPE